MCLSEVLDIGLGHRVLDHAGLGHSCLGHRGLGHRGLGDRSYAPMMCFGRRFYKASRMMSFAKNDAYDLRNCCVKLRNDAYCSSNSVVSTSDVVN